MLMPASPLARLGRFRAELYACVTRRADALFELGDALLSAQAVPSLPHLSLQPVHQRGWGSTYAALARGSIDTERLRDLLAGCLPPADPLVFAVDVTTWPRCDAECSPQRGYYYHPSRHSAGQPIVAGWAYQWIAHVSFDRDSWTAPVDARRLHPLDDTDQAAAGQVRALVGRLDASGRVPLFVFDGGYDSAQLTLDLAQEQVAVLVRLRSDRCFYADPPPRPPGSTGRPRRHGAKFAFADPATWPAPTATLGCQDDQYGAVTVQAWGGLHPKQQRHPGHGTGQPRPIVRGTIVRVQVERVPAKTRPPKVLWPWWAGPGDLDLDLAWRAYVRRFDLEHTVRFAKQTLGWTTPRPRHPEQADRWTWLVLASYAQLRLAREGACDQRLPWERPRPQPRRSPYRVRRGFPRLLCALGSPATTPKPAGRSPGRPKGRASGPATRYPATKKPTSKPRKKATKIAKAA
ncbi:MAG TPA: NF041680 family putative transposase [Actinomycetes bacterium]|nr:NF041680 family putative transposase [Actinomycetes bacterium]